MTTDTTADREMTLTRVIHATPARVFAAYTSAESLGTWWGPNGFTITTLAADIRVGGVWRFDMTGPDGHVYPNRIEYTVFDSPTRIEFKHGTDDPADPQQFLTTITFTAQGEDTLVTHRVLLATREQYEVAKGFGAIELGHQTLAKLAAFVE